MTTGAARLFQESNISMLWTKSCVATPANTPTHAHHNWVNVVTDGRDDGHSAALVLGLVLRNSRSVWNISLLIMPCPDSLPICLSKSDTKQSDNDTSTQAHHKWVSVLTEGRDDGHSAALRVFYGLALRNWISVLNISLMLMPWPRSNSLPRCLCNTWLLLNA